MLHLILEIMIVLCAGGPYFADASLLCGWPDSSNDLLCVGGIFVVLSSFPILQLSLHCYAAALLSLYPITWWVLVVVVVAVAVVEYIESQWLMYPIVYRCRVMALPFDSYLSCLTLFLSI